MNKIVLLALLFSFFEAPLLLSQSDSKATLEITFTGIRNSKGMIAVGINNSPEGWPRKPDMDPNWKKTGIKNGTMTVKVEGLEYGTYAVSMLDDENSNLEMDNFIGMPKEGFGFSNDAKVKMSPPKFEECSFEINKPCHKISIEVRYMGKGKE
ncbi:MAG: DUF2141 domain-containing protein [Bacteroidetes bacterium]|nr:DUF2141 domain-containing protein [Bacteroidota bacterium]